MSPFWSVRHIFCNSENSLKGERNTRLDGGFVDMPSVFLRTVSFNSDTIPASSSWSCRYWCFTQWEGVSVIQDCHFCSQSAEPSTNTTFTISNTACVGNGLLLPGYIKEKENTSHLEQLGHKSAWVRELFFPLGMIAWQPHQQADMMAIVYSSCTG